MAGHRHASAGLGLHAGGSARTPRLRTMRLKEVAKGLGDQRQRQKSDAKVEANESLGKSASKSATASTFEEDGDEDEETMMDVMNCILFCNQISMGMLISCFSCFAFINAVSHSCSAKE